VAVLELDEAHGVHFARAVRPTHTLLLNVLRDQLDRFGEIDTTARLLERIARATTTTVIANREDSRLVRIGESLEGVAVRWIGLGPATRAAFRSDDELHGGAEGPGPVHEADVELLEYDGDTARFRVGGEELVAPLRLGPVYNAFNAAGAIALARAVLGDRLDLDRVREGLAGIEPAFGRGESFSVDGTPLELVLVKNPAGFRMALAAYPHAGVATMIVINDADADGRDVSWLWDVDFDELRATGVALTSGVRAADMALRLQYDLVPVGGVEDDIEAALRRFLAENPGPKRVFATYTAMLVLRRVLHGSSFGVLA
jgi:UDP-N-acetylmuramyl tripeptide synthase